MKDIINRFMIKINNKENNLDYFYNDKRINIDLTFNEQANDIDKIRKKLNIIAIKDKEPKNIIKDIISKDIICPVCKDNVLMYMDNFNYNFNGYKNNHNNEISLNEFEQSQKIDMSNFICNLCNMNNKRNNEFYICHTCNKNICPLCKPSHDKNHNIVSHL